MSLLTPDPKTAAQLRALLGALDRVARFRVVLVALLGAVVGGFALRHAGPDMPLDFAKYFRPAGLQLLHGHLSRVLADGQVQSGPLQLAWLAGVWRAAVAVGLPGLVTLGAVTGATLAVGTVAVTRFALPDTIAGPARARAELAAGVFLTIAGPLSGNVRSGHPAEMVIVGVWIVVVALARRGQLALAGLLLGAACGFETWAVLGAPLVLAAGWRPTGLLRAATTFTATVTALFAPLLVTGGTAMFAKRWLVMPGTLEHLLAPDTLLFTWPMRLAQATLAVAAAAVVAYTVRRRPSVVWCAPLAVVAVRLLTDPLLLDYYFAELHVCAALAVALWVAGARPASRVATAVTVVLPLATVFPPRLFTVATVTVVVAVATVTACRRAVTGP